MNEINERAMKTIKQEEFAELNKALHHLDELMLCMGIKEYTLSKDKHNLHIDTDATDIDSQLIYSFCSAIGELHKSKFGMSLPQTG